MAHKFRVQFGRSMFRNLPANSQHCRRCITPLAWAEFLQPAIRLWSFQIARGTVGGAIIFDSFTVTFPLPRRAPKYKFDIKDC